MNLNNIIFFIAAFATISVNAQDSVGNAVDQAIGGKPVEEIKVKTDDDGFKVKGEFGDNKSVDVGTESMSTSTVQTTATTTVDVISAVTTETATSTATETSSLVVTTESSTVTETNVIPTTATETATETQTQTAVITPTETPSDTCTCANKDGDSSGAVRVGSTVSLLSGVAAAVYFFM